MHNIYIDTSIFEANNFLESKRINEIFRLSKEGYIHILLPEITYNEIKSRIAKNVSDSTSRFNKIRNDIRILRNIPTLMDRFEPIEQNKILDNFFLIFDKKLKDSNIEVIPYSVIDVRPIFESYFHKQKPFSSGLKKDEFPDAFALNSVEKWCKENATQCLVFSKDKDLIHYESDRLSYIEYESYLSDLLENIETEKHEKRLESILEKFNENHERFMAEIQKWLNTQLGDESNYYSYSNYYEIHNLEILDTSIQIHDYKITSISEDIIYLKSDVKITYDVQLDIDDVNSGIYDDDDKLWNFFDIETVNVQKQKYITVDFKFQIPIAGEQYADVEIDEINEGKDLKL